MIRILFFLFQQRTQKSVTLRKKHKNLISPQKITPTQILSIEIVTQKTYVISYRAIIL